MNSAAAITEQERLDRLRLIRTENVGPVSYLHLMRRYGSAKAALEALPHLARRGGRSAAIAIYPRDLAEQETEALAGRRRTLHRPGRGRLSRRPWRRSRTRRRSSP